ncbi:MAG TPA: hypothetical protein VHS96_03475, partial [Bacteroidia bacterium]|nr:hypothetical protein [Bacteroidia bacterium]
MLALAFAGSAFHQTAFSLEGKPPHSLVQSVDQTLGSVGMRNIIRAFVVGSDFVLTWNRVGETVLTLLTMCNAKHFSGNGIVLCLQDFLEIFSQADGTVDVIDHCFKLDQEGKSSTADEDHEHGNICWRHTADAARLSKAVG